MAEQIDQFVIEDGIDIAPLLNAFAQFQEGLKVAKNDLERAGAIKLFEISFELSWKTMKRILNARGKDVNSPKVIFREAALERLIDDPELWFGFIDERNETVHTYNRIYAKKIFDELPKFESAAGAFIASIKRLKK